jgi:hypothetical protein
MESEKSGFIFLMIYALFWGFALASKSMVLIPVLFLVGIIAVALFKRQVTNMFYANAPRVKNNYVVVYFLKNAVKKPLKYFVIPDETGHGIIENGIYNLEKKDALPDDFSFKGRLHFLIEEGNPIPVKAEIKELSQSKILFKYEGKLFFEEAQGFTLSDPDKDRLKTWAFTVKRALVTTWFKILYAEVRQWAFIIAIIVAVVGIGISFYEYQYIQSVQPLISTIYQHTVIENASMIIKPNGG